MGVVLLNEALSPTDEAHSLCTEVAALFIPVLLLLGVLLVREILRTDALTGTNGLAGPR